MYEAIVIGSGPAGLSVAIYLKRAGKQVLIIEKEYEGTGQIAQSICVENYPGFASITGEELGETFRQHVLSLDVPFLEDEVKTIIQKDSWILVLASGNILEAASVIYAAGAVPLKLGIEGAASGGEGYEGKWTDTPWKLAFPSGIPVPSVRGGQTAGL